MLEYHTPRSGIIATTNIQLAPRMSALLLLLLFNMFIVANADLVFTDEPNVNCGPMMQWASGARQCFMECGNQRAMRPDGICVPRVCSAPFARNDVTWDCSNCVAGFNGPRCDIVCAIGFAFSKDSGNCQTQCNPGFYGNLCKPVPVISNGTMPDGYHSNSVPVCDKGFEVNVFRNGCKLPGGAEIDYGHLCPPQTWGQGCLPVGEPFAGGRIMEGYYEPGLVVCNMQWRLNVDRKGCSVKPCSAKQHRRNNFDDDMRCTACKEDVPRYSHKCIPVPLNGFMPAGFAATGPLVCMDGFHADVAGTACEPNADVPAPSTSGQIVPPGM